MKNKTRKNKLIIAYGNPYRNDDGVGHYVAGIIQNWADEKKMNEISIITAYQLDIDMAEDIAEAADVYFLDAHVTGYSPDVVIGRIEPKKTQGFTTHVFTPSDLIALSAQLYGKQPRGYIISVPGFDFDMGEELTEETRRQANHAAEKLKEMLLKQ